MPGYLHPRLPRSKTRFEAALQVPSMLLLHRSLRALTSYNGRVRTTERMHGQPRSQRAVSRYFASMAYMGYSV